MALAVSRSGEEGSLMKMAFLLGFAALAVVLGGPVRLANADTFQVGVQYTLPSGFSSQWTGLGGGGCGSPTGGGNNCATIPSGKSVRECTGTQSIKIPNVELLVRFICGSPSSTETIWQGHHLSSFPTVRIQTPQLPAADTPLLGNGSNACWAEYQGVNSGASSATGGGWEMQINCVAE
jgi:hypothetical protein